MHGIVDVVATLSRSVPDHHSIAELRDNLVQLRRVRAWLDGLEARIVSAFFSSRKLHPTCHMQNGSSFLSVAFSKRCAIASYVPAVVSGRR